MPSETISPGLNEVYLVGTVSEAPVFAFTSHGFRVYDGILDVARLSGNVDHVPFSGSGQDTENIRVGDRLVITGCLQSRDKRKMPEVKHRLAVSVYTAHQIHEYWEDENSVHLSGHICCPPLLRRTPFGRIVCEATLAVPKGYGPQNYVFCIAWGDMAVSLSRMAVGSSVAASGRFQSRSYVKAISDGQTQERTVFEVSLNQFL